MTINQGIQYIKNPYLSFHNGSDTNSLDNENYTDEISHSVKAINEKFANIEAEQHEVLFEDGKLYNILGKPHSKGGTPLNAKEGSFIFSKFSPLAINKKDKKLFELDAIKSDKNKNNSPAQILKKEVNIKHHNKMFKVLGDNMQDDISKKSAEIMLAKNLNIIGKIGYLQEEKKNFPTGVPTFADGSTPIVNKELENKIMQSSQFMQLGGMKKYALAGEVIDPNKCRYGTHPDGSCIEWKELSPEQQARAIADAEPVTQFSPGFTNVFNTNGLQIGQQLLPPKRGAVSQSKKLMSNEDWITFKKNETVQHKAKRLGTTEGDANYQKITTPSVGGLPSFALNFPKSSTPGSEILYTPPVTPVTTAPVTRTNLNDLTPGETLNYSANPFNSQMRLSPYQNANTAYLLGQALNVDKVQPMKPFLRSNAPFVETYDYQPMLSQIDNGVAQQYDAGRFSSSPQQAALNSLIAGKALQAKSQGIGQVNQMNVPLRNQQRAFAAQIFNGDNKFNVEQNLAYYDKTQLVNSNYRTLKQAGVNAAVGDYNTNLTGLDKFKQLEASQKMGQQYVRNNEDKIQLIGKDGKPEYFTEDELKTRKDEILKRGLTIQTRQVPLFSTDRTGRVINNRIDVNPLGMAGASSSSSILPWEEVKKMTKELADTYNRYLANINGKNERQPLQASQKLGGKISKRYTVKNPFN